MITKKFIERDVEVQTLTVTTEKRIVPVYELEGKEYDSPEELKQPIRRKMYEASRDLAERMRRNYRHKGSSDHETLNYEEFLRELLKWIELDKTL